MDGTVSTVEFVVGFVLFFVGAGLCWVSGYAGGLVGLTNDKTDDAWLGLASGTIGILGILMQLIALLCFGWR